MQETTCQLCQSSNVSQLLVTHPPIWSYSHCENCGFTSLGLANQMNPHDEKKRYDFHQNEMTDGYLKFMAPLIEQVKKNEQLENSQVLDFGCGPGESPMLAQLLSDFGANVTLYDIYYRPDEEYQNKQFDFITCTEVIEHVDKPMSVFDKFDQILKKSGRIYLMTSLMTDIQNFSTWSYRRDQTHRSLFNEKSLRWVAQQMQWKIIFQENPLIVFEKV